MLKINILSCLGLMLLLISCGSTSQSAGKESDFRRLDKIISEKSFEIISDQAFPMTTNAMISISNAGLFPPGSSVGQINLIGNPNYVKVMGDSLEVYLPYFGERQMGGGYNNKGPGIQFEGVPTKMEINKNDDKERYDIHIEMKDDSESFRVNIQLFPNLNSRIIVNSAQRFPIRYSGQLQPLNSKPLK